MKVFIDEDEWYPVYTLNGVTEPIPDHKKPFVFEVDDATHRRWQRVFKKFAEVQDEIEALMESKTSNPAERKAR